MTEFPSPADLRGRYETAMGFSLDAPAAAPLLRPYKGGEGARRYYQDAAIRAVFEKVAADRAAGRPSRALLSLATGAGKTFIAANLLRRVADAGLLKRALFLCDRDELRRQALGELTNYFGDAAREVYRDSDGRNHARNAAVQVATYQTLGVDKDNGDESFLTEFYPPDYFSHIVIDECHRSAWGKWSKVLKMNPQGGADRLDRHAPPARRHRRHPGGQGRQGTHGRQPRATSASRSTNTKSPRRWKTATSPPARSNWRSWTSTPAACPPPRSSAAIPPTPTPAAPSPRREIAGRYEANNFENKVVLPDRVKAMCRDLFEQMVANVIQRGIDGNAARPTAKDHHLLRHGSPRRPRGRRNEQPLCGLVRRPTAKNASTPTPSNAPRRSAATTSSPTSGLPSAPTSSPPRSNCSPPA